VLLSAMDPSFDLTSLDEGDTTWSHWSYRDISKIMREVVRTTKSGSPYTRALLADYADFAETLDGLCKRTAETTQADFLKLLTPETANELTGAHIHDLVYKLAFQHLTLELDQKLTIHGHLPTPSKGKWQDCANRDIWTGTNFTNSQGLCDVKILLRGSDNPLALGVQLQHRSLRLVLESTKDGNLEPTALRVLQSGFWFDFSPGLHGVGSIEYPKRGAEDFNRFGNKFLYRSRNLGHKGKEVMTCSEIADVLLRFIEHGYKYRERIAEVCFGN
jgi:hypothetical protein